jgi:arylsulfatase
VVLISLDTFRADHIGAYGARRPTPALDRLAAESVLFAEATTPAVSTLAAHTSLMTGSWPHNHAVPRNGFLVPEANVMLAELLRDAGFHTAGVIGAFPLESRFAFNQGFDFYDQSFDIPALGRLEIGAGNDQNQRLGEKVTATALAHLDQVRDQAERIFLFVHYFDAHALYAPPPDFAEATTGDRRATMDMTVVEDTVREHQARILGAGAASPPGFNNIIRSGFGGPLREIAVAAGIEPNATDLRLAQLYAGEAAYLDHEIGKLLEGLRARGMDEETLVVLTADHGETFWEHGDLWNHGLWVYQSTAHVPLLLRLPGGAEGGSVVHTPVSTIDLLPTLCELLKLAVPERCDGGSLMPLVRGDTRAEGPVFSEATQPWNVEPPNGWRNVMKPRSVRLGPWKYVRCLYNGVEQLFHLERDPHEQDDLLRRPLDAPARQELERLRSTLAAWEAAARPVARPEQDLSDAGTRGILEAMGYVGEEPDTDSDRD